MKIMNVYDELMQRGFIKQETGLGEDAEHPKDPPKSTLRDKLSSEKVTFYLGFDPTADSLHVGSLTPIMAMAHLQRAGHTPIALIGGGTAMIGDPSGKTEMRKMLSQEAITENGEHILAQLKRYLKFGEGAGMFLNNADWLLSLGYIDFLRDIGKYFRVNEMIKAEAYRIRLEREEGLSFLEFNYQLLQAYDFLTLYDRHNCTLQMGGDDQWGNMLAGSDLIRRMRQDQVYLLTFPLLTTATGQKMGKSESGAVWLDPAKTSPYEFYQYWINTDDRDVERFLKIFTFLPLDEIMSLCAEGGASLRNAKEVLAFEATRITHGAEEAERARATSRSLFGGKGDSSHVPTTELSNEEARTMKIVDLLVRVKLASSKGDATKLVKAGGVSVDDQLISDPAVMVSALSGGNAFLLRKGKKTYHRVAIGTLK
jgi:tyrosyl-tRNA synthetase